MLPAAAPLPLFSEHCVAVTYDPPLMLTNHTHEYVGVPVVGIADATNNPWSTSNNGLSTVGVGGAVRAEFTVTVAEDNEAVVSATVALSVTWSLKLYVAPTVRVPPTIVHVSVAPANAPVPLFVLHCVAAPYAPPLTETNHSHE